jgi:hypothetical protein
MKFFFLGTLAIILAGCGPRTGQVSGTVSFNGKPVTSGTVTMVSVDGIPIQSPIGEDGAYSLPQIVVGEAKIVVSSPPLSGPIKRKEDRVDPSTGKKIEPQPEQEVQATQLQKDTWRALPATVSDITQTTLRYTVKSGKNVYEIVVE